MGTALAIVNLLNATTPGVAQLILLIRSKDGSINVMAVLDEADDKFKENLKMAEEWLAAHKPNPGDGNG